MHGFRDDDEVRLRASQVPLRRVVIAVPARIGSTRLPRKLLRHIGPHPVIGHVAARLQELAQCLRSQTELNGAEVELLVATDDDGIAAVVREHGVPVFRSRAEHRDGTTRIREAWLGSRGSGDGTDDVVVNIQGDEPFFSISDVVSLVQNFVFSRNRCAVGTLAHRCDDPEQFLNPAVVKVVCRDGGEALYFSRAPIPWPRSVWGAGGPAIGAGPTPSAQKMAPHWYFWRHVGIYVYRGDFLAGYTVEHDGSEDLEHQEGLEQLGFLRRGERIHVAEAQAATLGIDTEADLDQAERLWRTGAVR